MNTIIVLVAIQTVWMIWRDLDARKYHRDISKLQSNYDADRTVLVNNQRNAIHEAEYWMDMYEKAVKQPRSDEGK